MELPKLSLSHESDSGSLEQSNILRNSKPHKTDTGLSFESLKYHLEKLSIASGSKNRLIEIGCGYGRITRLIAYYYRSFEVVGYDVNESFIEKALQEEKNQPLGISYHVYDAGIKIDPSLTGFNISVSINVLQNCASTYEILLGFAESHFDSLLPGGVCLIICGPSNVNYFQKQLNLLRQGSENGYKRIYKSYHFEEDITEIKDGVGYQSLFAGASTINRQWFNYFWSDETIVRVLKEVGFIDIKFVPHLLTNEGADDIELCKTFIECYRPK
jgi:SAM-dependent methyltransferase